MAHPVHLYAYDLSGGLAAQLSPLLLGQQVRGFCVGREEGEGACGFSVRDAVPDRKPSHNPPSPPQIHAIWHTSIVVHGREYYFGQGVSAATPGRTHFGTPLRTLSLGTTSVDPDSVAAWVAAVNEGEFSAARYVLLDWNCNHFSAAFCEFLTGASRVPPEYTNQGAILMSSPLGAALAPSLGGLEAALRVHEPERASVSATADRAADAVATATGRAVLADAAAAREAGTAPATAAVTPLAAQEAAVARDVAAGAASAKAEFEALVRSEFEAIRASEAGVSANEAARMALDRATVALRRTQRAK